VGPDHAKASDIAITSNKDVFSWTVFKQVPTPTICDGRAIVGGQAAGPPSEASDIRSRHCGLRRGHLSQALTEGGEPAGVATRGRAGEEPDHRHSRLLPCAASGHAAATPPSRVMNSRRLMLDIASPTRLDAGRFTRRLNLPQKGRQVFGADLNRSESGERYLVSKMIAHTGAGRR
jgi:hypothetical protein